MIHNNRFFKRYHRNIFFSSYTDIVYRANDEVKYVTAL